MLGSYNKQNKNTNLFYMNFYYEMKLYTCYDVNGQWKHYTTTYNAPIHKCMSCNVKLCKNCIVYYNTKVNKWTMTDKTQDKKKCLIKLLCYTRKNIVLTEGIMIGQG